MVNIKKSGKEQMKEIKENSDLIQFVKTLTKEELQRIKDTREFETIKPGTPTYKIAVLCDQLRQNVRRLKLTIRKRLWSIDDLSNNIFRLKVQLESGKITELIKDDMVMNESELKSLIQHNEWLKDGEFYALYALFAELRGAVGHKDVSKKVIMEIEVFDKFIVDTMDYLKEYGYDFFGELG